MERKRIAEAAKGIGRPKVGGQFELVDQDGRTFTDRDMRGKYALVSLFSRLCSDKNGEGVQLMVTESGSSVC